MNQEITAQDAPKIALIIGIVLCLLTGGWFAKSRMDTQREDARMADRMDLESDMPVMTRAVKPQDEVEIDPEKQLLVRTDAR